MHGGNGDAVLPEIRLSKCRHFVRSKTGALLRLSLYVPPGQLLRAVIPPTEAVLLVQVGDSSTSSSGLVPRASFFRLGLHDRSFFNEQLRRHQCSEPTSLFPTLTISVVKVILEAELTKTSYRPSSLTTPSSITTTLSARAIVDKRCAAKMTVMLFSLMILSIAALTAFSEAESRADVASSSSRMDGFLTRARAIEIRCR